MGLSPLFFSFPRLLLIFFTTILIFFKTTEPSSDSTKQVFRGCATQKFQDPSESGIYAQTLKSLFESLLPQAMTKTFSSTTSGVGQSLFFGLYQCRGDLNGSDCYNCASRIPEMAEKECGKAVSARIQLRGCYMRYEINGFKQVSDSYLLYRACESTREAGAEFEQRRDSALGMVAKGVIGSGFYTGTYESVYVLGQCEGDLDSEACGDCVDAAVGAAKIQCGDSISAHVYLHKCYISYAYYPNGIPAETFSGEGTHESTKKKVALAVGGVGVLVILLACVLYAKSVLKKRGGGSGGGGGDKHRGVRPVSS